MFHPLAPVLTDLSDQEVESMISSLTKKYFQTSNPDLKMQVSAMLEHYKQENHSRRLNAWQEQYNDRDKDLDKLINID